MLTTKSKNRQFVLGVVLLVLAVCAFSWLIIPLLREPPRFYMRMP